MGDVIDLIEFRERRLQRRLKGQRPAQVIVDDLTVCTGGGLIYKEVDGQMIEVIDLDAQPKPRRYLHDGDELWR